MFRLCYSNVAASIRQVSSYNVPDTNFDAFSATLYATFEAANITAIITTVETSLDTAFLSAIETSFDAAFSSAIEPA